MIDFADSFNVAMLTGQWSSRLRRPRLNVRAMLRSTAAGRRFLSTAAVATLFIAGAPDALAALPSCGAAPSEPLVQKLLRQAPGLRPDVLRMALDSTGCAAERGLVKRRELLTVIDYSLPSTQPRLFTFNLATERIVFRELVAHGKNSGENETRHFSNSPGSLATSLGLFVTGMPYIGSNGYSLRLRGLEQGVNDRALERAIVMHGASYVSTAISKTLGRLGRSWGCPAVRPAVAKKMIDTLKGGTAIFAYYPDNKWLTQSAFLNRTKPASVTASGSR
jgi:hypothetical protein